MAVSLDKGDINSVPCRGDCGRDARRPCTDNQDIGFLYDRQLTLRLYNLAIYYCWRIGRAIYSFCRIGGFLQAQRVLVRRGGSYGGGETSSAYDAEKFSSR
jgi:hypothetical protein